MNEAKRRFIELKVNEISLVDTPANEKEFAVIKRLQEENDMAGENKKTEVKKAAEEELKNKGQEPDGVEVEVDEPSDDEIKKALDKVVELASSLVKKTAEEKEEKPEEEAPAEEKPAEETPADDGEEEEDSEEETEKRTDVESEESKMLSALEQSISKAKRFTPGRMKSLKSVVESLQKLVEELSPNENAQPSANAFVESGISESGVTKALESFSSKLEKKLTGIIETSKKLQERLEKIEKTRQPSASVEEDGGTDKEAEIQKSFWHGAL